MAGPEKRDCRVSFEPPADVAVTTGPATVKAPGPPGSIEKGAEEERGYVLTATTRAADAIRVEVTLEVIGAGDQNNRSPRAIRP